MQKDPDMLEEYDFSIGITGKYLKKYVEGTKVVVIEPDRVYYFYFLWLFSGFFKLNSEGG